MKISHVWSQYIAEFLGTFFLVFFGCGAIILNELDPKVLPTVAVPLVFGGIISVMIYTVGHISGAHFNPAVTFAFTVIKKFPLVRLPGYVMAQFFGAIVASSFHLLIFTSMGHDFGVTSISGAPSLGIGLEILLSFLLMFVITSVATDARAVGELAGLAIGSTVALCAFVGGPLTGASMNPARSLGPALISGRYSDLWIYLVFCVIGASLGALTYDKIRCHPEKATDQGCC